MTIDLAMNDECLRIYVNDHLDLLFVETELLQCIGGSQSLIKQGMAWLAEKAGRFKLNDSCYGIRRGTKEPI